MLHKTLTVLIIVFSLGLRAQEKTDEVLGYYTGNDKNSIFKFYRSGDKYYGKTVWMKRAARTDSLNPDKSKRGRKILGIIVVWGFVKDGENTWDKGYIYDANSGKTYKSKISRDKNGDLEVRGYVGIKAIGKTMYFTKTNFKEK